MPRNRLADALAAAGVAIGGKRPWDVAVHNPRLAGRITRHGLVGLGDAYVDRWWDCPALDQLFDRLLRADIPSSFRSTPPAIVARIRETLFNPQRRGASTANIHAHYDLGNDLFRAMLDRRMVYSCALWDGAPTLDEAQEAKLDLICRKLCLEPGMRLLDIGCGWGGLARYAAEHHGCSVVGITLSPRQASVAEEQCRGLPVKIRLQDYRTLWSPGAFDRVVSVGMFEHVGPKNHRAFMRTVDRCLAPGGLALLHFFATRRSWPNRVDSEVLWVQRHIFPGMAVPSMAQVGRAADGLFVFEDLHNIGADYDATLMAWFDNFNRAWPDLSARYGEPFYRMWKYYLLSCAGAFRSRKYHVWQIVLSRKGVPGGYRQVRATAQPAAAPHVVRPRPTPASREDQRPGQPRYDAADTPGRHR